MPQKDKARLGALRRDAGVPEHRAGYARKKDIDRSGATHHRTHHAH